MISLFLGLSVANVLLLAAVTGLGFFVTEANTAATADYYAYHITLGIASGMMATATHTIVFAYFMATAKWLRAATDKADLDPRQFVGPATDHKHRALAMVMVAIAAVVMAMFAGAAADPTLNPWLPKGVHLLTALTALTVNLVVAVAQFRLIGQQGRLMDRALVVVNQRPPLAVDHA